MPLTTPTVWFVPVTLSVPRLVIAAALLPSVFESAVALPANCSVAPCATVTLTVPVMLGAVLPVSASVPALTLIASVPELPTLIVPAYEPEMVWFTVKEAERADDDLGRARGGVRFREVVDGERIVHLKGRRLAVAGVERQRAGAENADRCRCWPDRGRW